MRTEFPPHHNRIYRILRDIYSVFLKFTQIKYFGLRILMENKFGSGSTVAIRLLF